MSASPSPTCLTLVLVLLGATLPAAAQGHPKVEIGGGYLMMDATDTDTLHGWYADVAGSLTEVMSIVGQVNAGHQQISETVVVSGIRVVATGDLSVYTYLGGVRFSVRRTPRVVPFWHSLVGISRATASVTGTTTVGGRTFSAAESESTIDAIFQFGGGANVMFTSKLGVQAGADWVYIPSDFDSENAFRFAAGGVVAF
jgi:hypothetical protein